MNITHRRGETHLLHWVAGQAALGAASRRACASAQSEASRVAMRASVRRRSSSRRRANSAASIPLIY